MVCLGRMQNRCIRGIGCPTARTKAQSERRPTNPPLHRLPTPTQPPMPASHLRTLCPTAGPIQHTRGPKTTRCTSAHPPATPTPRFPANLTSEAHPIVGTVYMFSGMIFSLSWIFALTLSMVSEGWDGDATVVPMKAVTRICMPPRRRSTVVNISR